MTIPMVDLRPMLAATEPAWRANLERLFERELAAALGARFAVTAASGTAAIELGIGAAGLAESGAGARFLQ
jgi:dTDP-4-amino-4,6-dideoxygalactose transaminase